MSDEAFAELWIKCTENERLDLGNEFGHLSDRMQRVREIAWMKRIDDSNKMASGGPGRSGEAQTAMSGHGGDCACGVEYGRCE